VRAAKLLLGKDELPEDLSKEGLRDAAAGVVVVMVGRLFSDEDQGAVLRDLIRATAKLAKRSEALAGAMLARVCFVSTGDLTDSIRRLVHDERVEGWEQIVKLPVSTKDLAKIDKIAL
jgi:hypothetical protein